MSIDTLIKILSLGGGAPGTAQEPWNPASRFASGAPQSPPSQPMGQSVPPPLQAPVKPQSLLGTLGQAVAPQTYAALQEGSDQRGILGDIGKALAPQTYNALSGKGGGVSGPQ